jgi:hypothetical protein
LISRPSWRRRASWRRSARSTSEPEAARFGFAAFANEGPVLDHIEPVFRQRQIAQYLIESLIEATAALDPFGQTRTHTRQGRTRSACRRDCRTTSLLPKSRTTRGGLLLRWTQPPVSARVPGFIDTIAFRFVFTGQTAALRTFLNQLASFELPVLVREVEVDTASAEEATAAIARGISGCEQLPAASSRAALDRPVRSTLPRLRLLRQRESQTRSSRAPCYHALFRSFRNRSRVLP